MAATDPARRSGDLAKHLATDGKARLAPDAAVCPLCSGPNQCVLGDEGLRDTTCWCAGHRFPDTVFARVPPADLGRRCVCQRCALGDDPSPDA